MLANETEETISFTWDSNDLKCTPKLLNPKCLIIRCYVSLHLLPENLLPYLVPANFTSLLQKSLLSLYSVCSAQTLALFLHRVMLCNHSVQLTL